MSAQAEQESHISWDVEGWVRAALRAWARDYEEIEVVRHMGRIELLVDDRPIAQIEVRKIPHAVG